MLKRIRDDMKQARRDKDEIRLSVFRLLVSKIQYVQVEKGAEELDDKEVLAVVQGQIKQRKDSIAQFRAAGREESAQTEEAEMAVLMMYLPEQLDGESLRAAIQKVIQESGASSKKDMGTVMKAMVAAHQGQYDGKECSRMVGELLG